ncbi:MAG: flagellar hook-associated protein FlgK [Candidatus Tectomicrobia bacterium RIFCSPLOWO2_12_FULL_69_37]|nr:MAG: flagellar hook-associated protein FlgK [Candidatus Tectomicrobia bacterium RIFCSPLOWO2_02_FULL_70_19]OGL67329.1 MAG: flagellar hook-associated protein FlgK [Candidatus Tectomicrobia bacterium RIFCSPLOWO2_12_FULL_69_37]
MGLQSVLNLGKNSLAQNQVALQTIAHNIANAGVEGYSRQESIAVNTPPTQHGFGFLGTGVRVDTIRQAADRFLNGQIVGIKAEFEAFKARSEAMKLAETFLNEGASNTGISSSLVRFFQAAEALSARPEGAPERTDFVNAASNLARVFNTTAASLQDLQVQADRNIVRGVAEMNDLVGRMSDLNARIQVSEAGGHTANDLRDERQRVLERMSELGGVDAIEDKEGAFLVIAGRSFPIVQKGEGASLVAVDNPDNVVGTVPPVALKQVYFKSLGGELTDITARITDGQIGGLLQFRDGTINRLLDDLNNLAATIVNEVNIIHRQGYGLDGSTSLDLFNPLKISVDASSANSRDPGTKSPNIQAVLSDSRIFDPTALSGAKYTIRFASPTSFNVLDAETGLKLDATKVSVNGGPFGTDATVVDFAYAGTQVSVEFEGLRVTIQNFAGVPQKDDSFTVSIRKDAARNIAVSTVILGDISKVAASGQPGVPADNSGILAIADLRGRPVAQRRSSTLGDFLSSILSTFGTEARDVRGRESLTDQFAQTLKEAREGVAGVSIDEEMANVVRYQQNFGATARMMAITTQLLNDIIDIV